MDKLIILLLAIGTIAILAGDTTLMDIFFILFGGK